MKTSFLILFIIYISEITNTNAKILPRSAKPKRIENFSQGTLEMRNRYENKYDSDNYNIRKANTRSNIPVYIITRSKPKPKPIQRTGGAKSKYDNLFDENGMFFVTQPKAKKEVNYIDFNGRRTYDLSKRNRRKLMAMMNKELNRQLLEKANNYRREFEVDFTDLVA